MSIDPRACVPPEPDAGAVPGGAGPMTASGEAPSVAAQRLVGLVAGFGVAGFAVLDGA